MNPKGFVNTIVIVIVIAIALGIGYFVLVKPGIFPNTTEQQQIATKQEISPSTADKNLPTPLSKHPSSLSNRLKAEIIFVTVADLVDSPNTFLDRKVKVTGTLINTKSSYFPSPDFAITDSGASRFSVTSWLPLEIPPPPPGTSEEQPRTMQLYLNRKVNLVGTVKKSGPSFYLEVTRGEYALVD